MTTTQLTKQGFILPAEWFPQSGIQLTWPHCNTDWQPYLEQIIDVFTQLAKIITQHEQLLIVTENVNSTRSHLMSVLNGEQMKNIILHECNIDDTWARDHAPLSLTALAPAHGLEVQHRLLDFCFNGWGEKFVADHDNAITRNLYYAGIYNGILENHNDFVLEGGAIESDGNGTIFTTSMCMLAPHRNNLLTKTQIEKQLKKRLHAKRVVWIDHGTLIGDDTDGHIDTIVRIAPDNTILYVGCDDKTDEQYADFNDLEQQLKELKTLEGKPYRLLKLPMPDAIYDEGERLPATYANFIVANNVVIYPTYAQEDRDNLAKEIIKKAFPHREIIGVDAQIVIRQHGSLHCLTMQYPKGVLQPFETARMFD